MKTNCAHNHYYGTLAPFVPCMPRANSSAWVVAFSADRQLQTYSSNRPSCHTSWLPLVLLPGSKVASHFCERRYYVEQSVWGYSYFYSRPNLLASVGCNYSQLSSRSEYGFCHRPAHRADGTWMMQRNRTMHLQRPLLGLRAHAT